MKYGRAILFIAMVCIAAHGQQEQGDVHITPRVPEKIQKPRRDKPQQAPNDKDKQDDVAGPITPGDSSSRETKIDLSAPKDEQRAYPESDISSDVQEVHPWDPHKAQKDVEVGDFYFKRGNYRGAMMRYESALKWQDNNAEAMFKAGQTAEKLKDRDGASRFYADYLKTLPHGEHADEARKAIAQK